MEKGSELFGVLKAILIGLVLEAIYFIVGDLVIGGFVKYSVMVFFAYIFFACAAGFIHVPNPAESDAETKSELGIDEIAKGIQICVETVLKEV